MRARAGPFEYSMNARPDSAAPAELPQFGHILDVRSPSEFALDHVPGALNVPVLDDLERARVGTVYVHDSPFAARKLGAALVAGNIARHVETRFRHHDRHWKPLVYCWRGGQRSGALTTVLRAIGWDARQLEGGYRAWRRQVVADLEAWPARFEIRVLCGLTGTGKSRLLRALAQCGEQVLDLESLAAHRGSILGDLPGEPQPSQKRFESRLWDWLRRLDASRPVYAESESPRVGAVRVPEAVVQRLRASACLRLEAPMALRVALLRREYNHYLDQPHLLEPRLRVLAVQHGHGRVRAWLDLAAHGQWDALVADLLERHYDPAYLRSIGRHFAAWDRALPVPVTADTDESWSALARALAAAALPAAA
jgi:tRNA 2-selenouridine synthase